MGRLSGNADLLEARQHASGVRFGVATRIFLAFGVVAGLLPRPALRLTRAARAGDHEATRTADAAFAPLWSFLETAAPRVLDVCDPTLHLAGISDAAITLGESDDALAAFLATETVGSLSNLLGGEDASRVILALGLLLQPVMHSKPTQLDKSLVLPLPAKEELRASVAAFWLELVAPFVRRTGFDLALFLTDHAGQRQDASPLLAGWNARRIRIAAIERERTEQLACGAMVLVTGELRIHLDGGQGRQLHCMRLLRVWARCTGAPGVHLLSLCMLPATPRTH